MDNFLKWANVILLALTFGAIVWYSFETRWLRQETEKQNAVAIRPILVVEFMNNRLSDNAPNPPGLINIGFGPAFNVHVDDIENGRYRSEFPIFLMIGVKNTVTLAPTTYENGQYHNVLSPQFQSFISLMRENTNNLEDVLNREFVVHYEDTVGRRYISRYQLSCTRPAMTITNTFLGTKLIF